MTTFRYDIYADSDQGQVRENNEDAVLTLQMNRYVTGKSSCCAILAVADGVGGGPAGQIASEEGITSFYNAFFLHFLENKPKDITKIIEDSFRIAHQNILEKSVAHPEYHGMATTLTVAFIDNLKCYIGHVGDSRCYLINNGEIRQITPDQAIGRILQQALGVENQLLDQNKLLPFNSQLNLKINDCILLCSDGLSDLVDKEAVLAIVRKYPTAKETCNALIAEANLKGGIDNISVALIKVLSSDEQESS